MALTMVFTPAFRYVRIATLSPVLEVGITGVKTANERLRFILRESFLKCQRV